MIYDIYICNGLTFISKKNLLKLQTICLEIIKPVVEKYLTHRSLKRKEDNETNLTEGNEPQAKTDEQSVKSLNEAHYKYY